MSRITNLIFLLLIVSIVICYSSNAKTVDEDITKSTQQKNNEDPRNPRQRSFSIQYQDHAPIYIDGNDDFATQATMEGWDGDGTPSAPYIIDGLDIKGEPVDFANGFIDIENTEVHFKIINCYIFGNGPYKLSGNNYNGIRLYKIKNGYVSNNIVFNNGMQGIYLGFSDNTTIASNTIYQNSANGIWVIDTDDSSIVSNTIYDNDWHGILLEDSDRNEITSNTIHDNGRNGIRLEYNTNNNIVISNNVYDNGRAGILLYTNDVEIDGSGNITETNNNYKSIYGLIGLLIIVAIPIGIIVYNKTKKGEKEGITTFPLFCPNCELAITVGNFCANCGIRGEIQATPTAPVTPIEEKVPPVQKFCSNCGTPISNVNFCPNCGMKV